MEESIPTHLEQNIVNTNLAVKSLINDIKKYDGSMEDLKKLYDFGRTKTSYWRELIDELEIQAREETDETTKRKLIQVVKTEKDQLHSTLKEYQKAYIDCVLSIEKKNKEELFAISNPDEVLRRRTRNRSSFLQENAEVTDHLSTVSRQLAEVVKQSSGALETLVKSSANITGIQEELKTTGSMIDQSGKILNKYQQREFTDKILIFFAFAFFIACVVYVIYSRL